MPAVPDAGLKLVLAEDHALLRAGLIQLLEGNGFTILHAVDNAPALTQALLDPDADAAVLDVRLPPTQTDEGLRAAIAVRAARPGFPVMVLSQYVEQLYARELLASGVGAVGYLLKDRVSDVAEFVDGVRRVAAGATVLDPEVVATVMARRRDEPLDRLTPREKKVLATKSLPTRVWMATGKKVYRFVTRRLMSYSDTEGRGPRVPQVGPRIAQALASHPAVAEVHMSDFQTLGGKVGLYAFVAPSAPVTADALRAHLAAALPDRPHLDHLQVVPVLPKGPDGAVRDDLLLLIARNQIEMLDQLAGSEAVRLQVAEIARGRLNLTDRITRPAA